jgi:hypothetical protein
MHRSIAPRFVFSAVILALLEVSASEGINVLWNTSKHSAKERAVLDCLEALTILSHAALSRPRLLHKKCECATDIIEAAIILAKRESYPVCRSNPPITPFLYLIVLSVTRTLMLSSSTLLDLYNKAFRQLNIPQYGSYHRYSSPRRSRRTHGGKRMSR